MLNVPSHLHTPRLTLRRLRAADAAAIFRRYGQDRVVTRYLSWRPLAAQAKAEAFLARVAEASRAGQGFAFAILPAGETELCGSIGFDREGGTLSFGYVLARSHWGRGLMPVAFKALVDWALTQPAVFRVQAFCHVENPASARVMEKAGLTFEGVVRRHTIYPNVSDEPQDSLLYARVR